MRFHRITLRTLLYIQVTYLWLTSCWLNERVASNSSCSTVINTKLNRSTNAQDLTELPNRLTVENLQRHVGLGFQPLQSKRQESGHPFLSFIWPVASSWDDHYFFKLTRDGKRALSQPATALCNSKSTGFALLCRLCHQLFFIQNFVWCRTAWPDAFILLEIPWPEQQRILTGMALFLFRKTSLIIMKWHPYKAAVIVLE